MAEIVGNVKIEDHTKDVKQEMEKKILKALEEVGLQAEGEAKIEIESSPHRVDTGLLRNSITYWVAGQGPHITSYKADQLSKSAVQGDDEIKSGSYGGSMGSTEDRCVYIGTNVEYALYVHEGTKKMTANRFLKNAVENNREVYKNIIDKVMKEE